MRTNITHTDTSTSSSSRGAGVKFNLICSRREFIAFVCAQHGSDECDALFAAPFAILRAAIAGSSRSCAVDLYSISARWGTHAQVAHSHVYATMAINCSAPSSADMRARASLQDQAAQSVAQLCEAGELVQYGCANASMLTSSLV